MSGPYSVLADAGALTREDWLALRRTGIGGSDAGAILGASPWASPLSVWADKRGILPERDESDAMAYGKHAEPMLRGWFAEEMAKVVPVEVAEFPQILRSLLYPWAIANLDGVATVHGETCGLELKTADRSQARHWREGELPDSYFWQVQHYMAVTGWPRFYVFALLGKRPLIRVVERNEPMIAELMQAERRLWEMVEANEMPAPSGLDCDSELLSALYQGGGEEIVQLDDEIDELMEIHRSLGASIKCEERERDELAQRIKLTMGNAKVGQGATHKATWSRFEMRRLDGAALKKEAPEVAERFTKVSKGERFIVSPNNQKEGKKDED